MEIKSIRANDAPFLLFLIPIAYIYTFNGIPLDFLSF